MRSSRDEALLRAWAIALILLCAIAYVLPASLRPLSRPDEVRYGEIARETIQHGDWIVPRFNGVRYFEKPVLDYWLTAASMKTLGERRLAIRLPAVLATGLTGLLIFLFTRRFTGRPAIGLAATAIYLSTFAVLACGTLAVLDAPLTLFLCAALMSWFLACDADEPGRRNGSLVACGAACGLAFLTKGFLGFVIPGVIAGLFLASRKRMREVLTLAWLPLLAALIVVAPWSIAIQLREADFWHYFFWNEHVRRFAAGDAQHLEPFWFYCAWAPVIFFPWIFFLPATLAGLRNRTADRGLVCYLWMWALLPFVLFSLARGKLVTYLLPCAPPLAILTAIGLSQLAGRRRLMAAGALLGATLLVACIAVLLATELFGAGASLYGVGDSPRWIALCALLALGATSLLAGNAFRAAMPRIGVIAVTTMILFAGLNFTLPERTRDSRMPGPSLLAAGKYIEPDALIVADTSMFGSVAWFLNRDDIYVLEGGELSYGLAYPEDRYRRVPLAALSGWIAGHRTRRPIAIVLDLGHEEPVRSRLPADARRKEFGRCVLWIVRAAGPAAG